MFYFLWYLHGIAVKLWMSEWSKFTFHWAKMWNLCQKFLICQPSFCIFWIHSQDHFCDIRTLISRSFMEDINKVHRRSLAQTLICTCCCCEVLMTKSEILEIFDVVKKVLTVALRMPVTDYWVFFSAAIQFWLMSTFIPIATTYTTGA